MSSAFASLQMAAGVLILLTTMTVSAERYPCTNDVDCPMGQYCNKMFVVCINYTVCSNYNREEGRKQARSPLQCGKCISGYIAKISATGEYSLLCVAIGVQTEENETISGKVQKAEAVCANGFVKTWIITTGIMSFIGAAVLISLFRKPGVPFMQFRRRKDQCKVDGEMCNFKPSAPPMETENLHGIFTVGETIIYPSIFDVNRKLTDRNRLVQATPFKEPSWIQVNPNYEQQLNGEIQNDVDQRTPPVEFVHEEDTNPSSWRPEETTVHVSARPFVQFSNEQRDNNTGSRQETCPASSSFNESNNGQPNPESSNAQNERDTGRPTNIMISQKITMNVNVMNGNL